MTSVEDSFEGEMLDQVHATVLLDTRQLADELGCSISTVKRQVAAGAIPVVKIGRLVRYRRSDISSMIETLTVATGPCR